MKTHLHNKFKTTGLLLLFALLLGSASVFSQNCDYTTYKTSGGGYAYLYHNTSWQTNSANLVTGNCHWYAMECTAGFEYTFKTNCGDGASADLAFDTYLTIYDWPDGNVLASDDDGCYDPANSLKSVVKYTVLTNRWIIVKVSGWANASGGNYTLAYRAVAACTAFANFSSSIAGADVNFTDQSSGAISTYDWNFGDGNTSSTQNPMHTYICSGSYYVTLSIVQPNACTNQYGRVINVVVPNGSEASFTQATSGNQISFTNTSTGTIVSYSWDFGDGMSTSNAASPVQTYTCSGYYPVQLTTVDNTGCSSTAYSYAYAEGDPKAAFTIASVSGTTVSITGAASGVNLEYAYDFGDGTAIDTNANPVHTYNCPGGYAISLVVNALGPCSSSQFSRYIDIIGDPSASFFNTVAGPTATFVNTSTGSITGYSWDFGDGGTSTAADPTRTYACPGSYFVVLTAMTASGCTSYSYRTVTVSGDPAPDFSASVSGTTVNFTDLSVGTGLTYNWYFGDGNSSTTQNPSNTYTCGGDKYVYFEVTNLTNCTVGKGKYIHVVGDPDPIFLSNVSGNTVTFSNATTGNVATQNWYFGDGLNSNAQAPTHIYSCPGIYNVYLEVTGTNGCVVPYGEDVIISGTPSADFTSSGSGLTTTFTDASAGSSLTYNWNFGDGSTSTDQNPVHAYTCGGSYYVYLTVSNGTCASSTTKIVEVIGDPYADYSVAVNGSTVDLTSTGVAIGNITNTYWYIYDPAGNFSYSLSPDPSLTLTDCGTLPYLS